MHEKNASEWVKNNTFLVTIDTERNWLDSGFASSSLLWMSISISDKAWQFVLMVLSWTIQTQGMLFAVSFALSLDTSLSDVSMMCKNLRAWSCVLSEMWEGRDWELIPGQVMIIIITFKGAVRDFLQSPHSAANCLQHAHSSGPGATACKLCATHRAHITCKCPVTCHLVRRDSSAIKFDRDEIAFIWALFYWLKH